MTEPTDALAAFEAEYDRLFALAYRMLGRVTEAEDVVQDAYERWHTATGVRSPRAFLTTVVTRLCIDRLRAARQERERYVGPWLPEPLVTDPRADPARQAELADALSTAFLLLLETLTPVERAVHLLHDVFNYSFADVAEVVGKNETNCRQIARRARQHLAGRTARFDTSPETRERLVQEFRQVCETGNLDGLIALLAADVTLYSDGGGRVTAALKPIYGADRVRRFLEGIVRKAPPSLRLHYAEVNGQPGLIATVGEQPRSVWAFDIAGGRVQNIYAVVNPDKLAALQQ